MRRPSPFLGQRRDLEIKMTPMIDVVFLLLVFFIWTSSFRIVEDVLPSRLTAVAGSAAPSDTPPLPEEDFDKIVVRILWLDGRPTWRVNDLTLPNLAQVRERLQTIVRIRQDAPVILHPDPEVALSHVIDLYDVTRLLGFEKIQFAASERI